MDNEWPWPAELDGVIAAPDHHRVIFENEEVRVLEPVIKAGDTTPIHTHRRPTVMYVVSGSHFVRRDENGDVLVDTRDQEPPFEMPPVIWSDENPAHTLENPSGDDLVVNGVELKR